MGHINFAKDMLTDFKGLIHFDAKFTPHSEIEKSYIND